MNDNNTKTAPRNTATRTAVEQVYEAIKQRILDGEYVSHQYVRESTVAKELDVSRTPVREALRELVSEGWLEAIPHHGARVTAWTEKDAREVFEIRLVLEPMAVAAACLRMDESRLNYLKGLARQMEALTERKDDAADVRNEIAALNHEFHRELIAACDNQRLIAMLQSLVRTSVIRRNFGQYNIAHLRRSMQHHAEILQAVEARNPAWAESMMRSHLLAARELHLKFIETPAD
ncbi:MAG: GntR family transcriptional regulator [Oceanospirillaceae bacterium]|nr:GntR family transcriptional regulator [Oceanospirillaceae bacterium]